VPNLTYEDAKAKVDARIGFLVHATVYVVINLVFLLAIGWDWLWVSLFWGIGLALHGISVFVSGPGGILEDFRERAIQKEMAPAPAPPPPPPTNPETASTEPTEPV
jgi:2TM domain